jgi:HTH-type transcriptional regulator/antitoxin HigA
MLMALLIRQYDESRYSLGHAETVEALRVLMESRGLRQRDLIPVFGSSSVASDVLDGKRALSKTHVRKLAEFFHVPVSLLI